MSKNNKTDYELAMARILGVPHDDTPVDNAADTGGTTAHKERAGKQRKVPTAPAKKQCDSARTPVVLVRKSFDITPEQHKALKLRSINDDSLNMSGHIRAALDQYLASELEKVGLQ